MEDRKCSDKRMIDRAPNHFYLAATYTLNEPVQKQVLTPSPTQACISRNPSTCAPGIAAPPPCSHLSPRRPLPTQRVVRAPGEIAGQGPDVPAVPHGLGGLQVAAAAPEAQAARGAEGRAPGHALRSLQEGAVGGGGGEGGLPVSGGPHSSTGLGLDCILASLQRAAHGACHGDVGGVEHPTACPLRASRLH